MLAALSTFIELISSDGAIRSGDRISVEARFSTSVQIDPVAHSSSYTLGTVSSTKVKISRPRLNGRIILLLLLGHS